MLLLGIDASNIYQITNLKGDMWQMTMMAASQNQHILYLVILTTRKLRVAIAIHYFKLIKIVAIHPGVKGLAPYICTRSRDSRTDDVMIP